MNMKEKHLTGYASIDKPWMQYYPSALIDNLTIPEITIEEYLKGAAAEQLDAPLLYYGNYISWETIFAEAEQCAKALRTLGFDEGDQIPVFLKSVPEFLTLFLGAEIIGASVLCRDNTLEENIEAVVQSNSKIIFAMDFLAHSDMNEYRSEAHVHTAILLSPYRSAIYKEIPDYIHESIDALYPKNPAHGPRTMDWDAFLALGDEWEGRFRAEKDVRRPLLRAYTSGSTGPSKQVIHSANTIIGNFHQLSFYKIPSNDRRTAFFQSPLPPALVAVVVAMTLFPLASGQRLILNPWVKPEDIDLELMRMKPESWSAIPMFVELAFHEGRIPEDMDMSWLKQVGIGCEPFNNRQIVRAQNFLNEHNSPAILTSGYGSSEAGSALTLPSFEYPQRNGNVGIPMPLTTISIFEPGTIEELNYHKTGEICVCGPGNMMGYDDEKSTARALQKHEDGQTWLHTGDIGFMNEDGVIFTMTRGSAPRYGFKDSQLATLPMENILADADIPGIDDEFFVIVPDPDHRHHFLPFLYVVLDRGYTVDDVRPAIMDSLEDYMRPVEIIQLPKRPFFHFKTNRIGLTQELRQYNFEN